MQREHKLRDAVPELVDLRKVALGDAEHPHNLLVDGVEVADELPPLLLLPQDLRAIMFSIGITAGHGGGGTVEWFRVNHSLDPFEQVRFK